MRLKAVTVRGSYRGATGHDRHVREFVRELCAQGVDVELQDIPYWSPRRLPDEMRDPWFDSLVRPCGAEVVVHFCMPYQAIPQPGKLNANFTMFEADRVPPEWVQANRAHELVILPTESSKLAWVKSGFPQHRISLCPLGIHPAVFSGEVAPLALNGLRLEDYRTRFLNVSEVTPRKNVEGLLEAWIRATSRADSALLILKIGFSNPEIYQSFTQRMDALKQDLSRAAPVVFAGAPLSDSEMPRLYATATHYISMSRGEGWDQTMMEAAASGLKLIAPAHSGYLAYLDSSIATLLPVQKVPVQYSGDPATAALFDGAHWWEPDFEQAVYSIRAAIEGRDNAEHSARDRVIREFTWAKATRRLIAILEQARVTRSALKAVRPAR